MRLLPLIIFLTIPIIVLPASAQEKMLFNTQKQLADWTIPQWTANNDHYVSPILAVDENSSRFGETSVKLDVHFSSDEWSAGIIETTGVFDLTLYRYISFQVYVPENAPQGLLARAIIVSGDDYLWIEMINAVDLIPGRRTPIKADLRRGNKRWKGTSGLLRITDKIKRDIRKIAIRIESNSAQYEGPVYIDRIKFSK